MKPEKIYPFVPKKPKGSIITRTLRAILIERRVPYAFQTRIDSTLASIGLSKKTVKVGKNFVTLRRCTADAMFVQNVLVNQEYFHRGYRPSSHDTIVDIGAQIGTFVLSAAAYATAGRIIAVEPFPENVSILKRNVKENRLKNVEVVSAAIGPSQGRGKLYIGRGTGFHSMKFDRGLGFLDVAMMTLEEIFDRYVVDTCDFLKIDCEGAEFDFLPQVGPSVWSRIRRLAMEFSAPVLEWSPGNPTDEQKKSKLEFSDQLIALLQEKGFRIDGYYDCVGFRAGYIFASNIQSVPG